MLRNLKAVSLLHSSLHGLALITSSYWKELPFLMPFDNNFQKVIVMIYNKKFERTVYSNIHGCWLMVLSESWTWSRQTFQNFPDVRIEITFNVTVLFKVPKHENFGLWFFRPKSRIWLRSKVFFVKNVQCGWYIKKIWFHLFPFKSLLKIFLKLYFW